MAHDSHAGKRMAPLVLGAIGVVYGDIGTSPLYTLRAVLRRRRTGSPLDAGERATACCRSSSGRWSIVVTLKYVTLIMRADNRGEGGILALTALVSRGARARRRARAGGSSASASSARRCSTATAMITPAISVLCAVEGLEIIAPLLHPFIVPVTLVDPRRAVRDPEARHRARRRVLRPGDAACGSSCWRCSACYADRRANPAVLAALDPALRGPLRRRATRWPRSSRSAPSCSR